MPGERHHSPVKKPPRPKASPNHRRSNRDEDMRAHTRGAWLAAFALVALPLVAAVQAGGRASPRRLLAAAAHWPAARSLVADGATPDAELLVPNRGNENANGAHTYYWRLPENVGTLPEPVGLLVLLHRCGGNGYDFWPRSNGCPECRGLPEEVATVKQALARGYAVMSINSLDRGTGSRTRCFHIKEDGGAVSKAIDELVKKVPELAGLPVYAMGVSAGGSLALQLARVRELDGAVPIVIGKGNEEWGASKLRNTPVVFIHMPRDVGMAAKVEDNMGVLSSLSVPNTQIRVEPRAVMPDYFAQRSPLVSTALSAALHAALAERGLLDGAGMLTEDPGGKNSSRFVDFYEWMEAELPRQLEAAREEQLALPGCNILTGNASSGGSSSAAAATSDGGSGVNATCLDPGLVRLHVRQGLEVAWADHEAVGDYTTAALAWLETRGQGDIAALEDEFKVANLTSLTATRIPPCSGGLPECCPASGSVGQACGAPGFYACAAIGIAPAAFLECPGGLVWDSSKATCTQPGELSCLATV